MEGLRSQIGSKATAITICLAGMIGGLSVAQAEFTLNFQPLTPTDGQSIVNEALLDCRFSNPTSSSASCNRMSSLIDPDRTPFYQETVRAADGSMYYHVIIGDPESDFAQEYYIQAGWGYWLGYNQFPMSASEGGLNGGADATPSGFFGATFGSPLDSDPTISGNGTANPRKMIFRQIVRGPGFEQEVIKDSFANKPKITQQVQDAEMVSDFSVDMSGISYSDASTSAPMTNTLVITDAASGLVYTDFDINDPANRSRIAAGQYTYSGGLPYKGSMGTYTYASGGNFDVYAVEWAAYRNADENVPDI